MARPVSDAGGGTAATGSISFTGRDRRRHAAALFDGRIDPVAVNSGDAATVIATNTVAAISAAIGVACTAAIDGTHAYQVDLTALHKGLAQNDIDIRFAYWARMARSSPWGRVHHHGHVGRASNPC